MLRNSKTPVIIGTAIPVLAYIIWLLFFSHHYPDLKDHADGNALLQFIILTSASMVLLSSIIHIGFSWFYVKKMAMALKEIQLLNDRIQGLTEDLSEIANYNQDQVTQALAEMKARNPGMAQVQITLNSLNDAAEEMSLRAEKTAIEAQFLDQRIRNFFVTEQISKARSKLTRKWESAYFFK